MNLLIVEYMSGGGLSNRNLSSRIISEAYGMLRTLIADLNSAGHTTITFLDSRLNAFDPPNEANKKIIISSPEIFDLKLRKYSGLVDAVYVIAPESDQTLTKLLVTIHKFGGKSFNSEISSVNLASNKVLCLKNLYKAGLKVPKTKPFNINEKIENINQKIKDFGYPVIFKPITGVGCEGLSVVENKNEIRAAIEKIAKETREKQFIVQELIIGKSVSASVYSTGNKSLAVTLNKQFLTLGSPYKESKYHGGLVPFDHKTKNKAMKAAENAVQAIKGLKGYVGVDMILAEDQFIVVEINPRLTVSYIGLNKILNFNPAEALVDSIIQKKIPKDIKYQGYCFFNKVKVPFNYNLISKTKGLQEIVAPPFPLKVNESSYALIATSSKTMKNAELAFYNAKNHLLKYFNGA